MPPPGRSHPSRPWLRHVALAAGLAGIAAAARATDPVQAALSVDPAVAVIGEQVNVTLTVTNTGAYIFWGVRPYLTVTSGADLVEITSVPWQTASPSASVYMPAGSAQTFTWTLTMSGAGTVHLTGAASGYLNSQPYSVESTAILVIPTPSPPTIRILNNVLKPGRVATIVLHGSALGTVRLVVYDQSGAPLGLVGTRPVTLDANGFGSVRFDGTVSGRRLSTGMYWIVASGAAAAKGPVLVTSK